MVPENEKRFSDDIMPRLLDLEPESLALAGKAGKALPCRDQEAMVLIRTTRATSSDCRPTPTLAKIARRWVRAVS